MAGTEKSVGLADQAPTPFLGGAGGRTLIGQGGDLDDLVGGTGADTLSGGDGLKDRCDGSIDDVTDVAEWSCEDHNQHSLTV